MDDVEDRASMSSVRRVREVWGRRGAEAFKARQKQRRRGCLHQRAELRRAQRHTIIHSRSDTPTYARVLRKKAIMHE